MGRFISRMLFVGGVAVSVVCAPIAAYSDEACEIAAADEPLVSETETGAVEGKSAEKITAVHPTEPKTELLVAVKPRPLFQHTSYPAAWKAAQQSNRPILVFVSMPNCHYCVKMKDQVYQLPHVKDLVSNSFESIKADRFAHPKLISSLKIRLYPTTVLVGPNNKILDVIEGYADANSFQRRLQTGIASTTTTVAATATR